MLGPVCRKTGEGRIVSKEEMSSSSWSSIGFLTAILAHPECVSAGASEKRERGGRRQAFYFPFALRK